MDQPKLEELLKLLQDRLAKLEDLRAELIKKKNAKSPDSSDCGSSSYDSGGGSCDSSGF